MGLLPGKLSRNRSLAMKNPGLQINIRFHRNPEELKQLNKLAIKLDRSKSWIVRKAISEFLQRNQE